MDTGLCLICAHRPVNGRYCYYADIWIDPHYVPGCPCFKREHDPVYNPKEVPSEKDSDGRSLG